MKKHLALLFAVALLFAGCSKKSSNPIAPVIEYAVFDITNSYLDVIDDGNSLSKAKLYFVFGVVDENDNFLHDENGNDCSVIMKRDNYISVGSGEKLYMNKDFKGIKIPKQEGKIFAIKCFVWDYFSSSADKVAGEGTTHQHVYPAWKFDSNASYGYKLVNGNGTYNIDVVYHVKNVSGL